MTKDALVSADVGCAWCITTYLGSNNVFSITSETRNFHLQLSAFGCNHNDVLEIGHGVQGCNIGQEHLRDEAAM
jgi:hypothetical protein